jgi:hypothetical protein
MRSKHSKLTINNDSNRLNSYDKENQDTVEEIHNDKKNNTGEFRSHDKEENKSERRDYYTPKVKRIPKASINDILLKLNKRNSSNQHSIFKE